MDLTIQFNASDEEYMDFVLHEINTQEVLMVYPLIVFYAIILSIGVLGNAVVLVVYSYRYKRSPARVYILFLAAIDFSICLVGLPYQLIDMSHPYTYTNTLACKTLTFIMTTLFHMSIFGLIGIAIDRYLKICRPLGKLQITDFGKRRICIVALISGVLFSWPNLILYGRSEMETPIANLTGYACFYSTEYLYSSYPFVYTIIILCVCIGSTGFLIISYSLICHRICTRYQRDNLIREGSVRQNFDSECADIELQNINMTKVESDDSGENESSTDIKNDNNIGPVEGNNCSAVKEGNGSAVDGGHCSTMQGDNHNDDAARLSLYVNKSIADSDDGDNPKEPLFACKSRGLRGYDSETHSGKLIKNKLSRSHEMLTHLTPQSFYGSLQTISPGSNCKESLLNPPRKARSMHVRSKTTIKTLSPRSASSRDIRKQLLIGRTQNEGMRIHSQCGSFRGSVRMRGDGKSSPNKQHSKITRIMLTVTLVFVLSYTPTLVVTIWTVVQPEFWDLLDSNQTILCEFFLRLYLINNICNPFIYGFWDKRFKHEIVYIIRNVVVRVVNVFQCFKPR